MNWKQGKQIKFDRWKKRYRYVEFRVRLTKRRPAGGGSKVANVRLIQRYRPFLESEEKIQV
jgi:hypothetical protein